MYIALLYTLKRKDMVQQLEHEDYTQTHTHTDTDHTIDSTFNIEQIIPV